MSRKKKGFYAKELCVFLMAWVIIVLLCSSAFGKDKVNLGFVGRWGNRGGKPSCVEIDSNIPAGCFSYAYCGTMKGLIIVNVTDAAIPKETAFLEIGEVNDIAFYKVDHEADKYAVLANGEDGLRIIDISDPSGPKYSGQFNTSGDAQGVAVSGNYAYVADGGGGLVIIDISDPSGPRYAGQFDTSGVAQGVAVSGNYAYVADEYSGLVIIDISDPSGLKYAGQCDTSGYARGVAISGNYAYVADGGGGLVIIDISDPRVPQYARQFDNSGDACDVAVSGNCAYVADGHRGLMIIDISDPSGPQYAGQFDTSGYAYGVAISGNYAYVADGDSGLVIIDISDPSGLKYAGKYNTSRYAYRVAISGNYAYVADGSSGLVIIDISDPSSPQYAGQYNTSGWAARGAAISGNYAYVADDDGGLVIIDISDPSSPQYAGQYNAYGWAARGVAISSNYAYVADGDGLVIIDISNPSGPKYAGQCDTSGYACDVAISGNYAYVADGDSGLVIIDISDPSGPKYAGQFDTPGYAQGVAISGNYAYVADGDSGLAILQIIDIQPSQGNLILCPSGPASATYPLWSSSQALANLAYSTFFVDQNYPHYFTYYLNPNPYQDIDGDNIPDPLAVDDFDPSVVDINYSLTDWACNRLNTGPLYLYLTGRGTLDAYQIAPGQILKASDPIDPNNPHTLKYSLDTFQQGTGRDTICLLEFASSGSFCDNLIDPDTPPYSRTIITCTDDGTSYLDFTGQHSFTGQLLTLFQNPNQSDQLSGLFADTGISHKERVHLLQGLFSQARNTFWSPAFWPLSAGYPFTTQPPQMVTAQGPHTLCSISLTADPLQSTMPDPNQLTITNPDQSITLKATGHYLDGDFDLVGFDQPGFNLTSSGQSALALTGFAQTDLVPPAIDFTPHIHYHSSDPTILQVTPGGKVSPNHTTKYNGQAYILATIIDTNFTQAPDHDPNIPPLGGVTGRIPITVDIADAGTPECPGSGWKEKEGLPLAIIVAGEKEHKWKSQRDAQCFRIDNVDYEDEDY